MKFPSYKSIILGLGVAAASGCDRTETQSPEAATYDMLAQSARGTIGNTLYHQPVPISQTAPNIPVAQVPPSATDVKSYIPQAPAVNDPVTEVTLAPQESPQTIAIGGAVYRVEGQDQDSLDRNGKLRKMDGDDGSRHMARLSEYTALPKHQAAFLARMRERLADQAICMTKVDLKIKQGEPFKDEDVDCFMTWNKVCTDAATTPEGKNACGAEYEISRQHMLRIAEQVRATLK